jgi:branched-chain amino acid transport system permease protein
VRAAGFAVAVLLAAAALGAPFLLSDLDIRLTNLGLISAIAVVGLTFAFGYCGLIQLGQAAFVGLGAYMSALLAVRLGLNVWLTIPAGIVFAATCAALLGYPLLRLRGHYLALATVGLNVSMELVARSWTRLTGGFDGITGIPRISILAWEADEDREVYWIILAFLLLACGLAWLIRHSHLGRAMIAVRDDEIASGAAGVSITRTKVAAFTLAGAYGGLAGALYAHYAAYISPSDFALVRSIEFLAMAVVGGEASILGAVIGALFFTYLPEWLRVFGAETYPTFFGLITLAALILMPTGLVGLVRRLRARAA